MKRILVSLFLSGCAHTAIINTVPVGATVRVDGKPIGVGPAMLVETSGLGRTYKLEASKEGYYTARLEARQTAVNPDLATWGPAGVIGAAGVAVATLVLGMPVVVPLAAGAAAAGVGATMFFGARQLQDEITLVLYPAE
jgi:hypothetical protein